MPMSIARRVLDLLSSLAKHDARAALCLVTLPVPLPSALHRHIAQQASRAAKGKAKADEATAGAAPFPAELPASLPAVQVLLGLLGRPFCSRSSLHLEFVLSLLEAGLGAAQTRVKHLEAREADRAATRAAADTPGVYARA